MTDLSEPGDYDAWLHQRHDAGGDADDARRRLRRRNTILDWFQIGFLVLVPVLSVVTIVVARHADSRAGDARRDTHALTGDVSSLSASIDRLTKNQTDEARLEQQVADVAEAFRRIATATTPEERQSAIDALNAVPPPASSTTTTTTPPASTVAPQASPASSPPSSTTSTSSSGSTPATTPATTRRPLLPPVSITIPRVPARSASSPLSWPYWPAVGALSFLLAIPAVHHHRKET